MISVGLVTGNWVVIKERSGLVQWCCWPTENIHASRGYARRRGVLLSPPPYSGLAKQEPGGSAWQFMRRGLGRRFRLLPTPRPGCKPPALARPHPGATPMSRDSSMAGPFYLAVLVGVRRQSEPPTGATTASFRPVQWQNSRMSSSCMPSSWAHPLYRQVKAVSPCR
ncbi:hypothetical protein VUR80DRAFT_3581 [Thermomyces stellatus]